LEIGIPVAHMKIILGYYHFFIILKKIHDNNTSYKFNLEAFLFNHKAEIDTFEDKSFLNAFYSSIKLMQLTKTSNINITQIVMQLDTFMDDYSRTPSFINFVNVAVQYYFLFEVEKLIKFMQDNIGHTMELFNWRNYHFLFAIVFRPYNYMLKNAGCRQKYNEFFELLDTKFYNAIMLYDSYNNYYKFLLHRVDEDDECKKLKDEDGRIICVVCLEDLHGKSIYCICCKKYVGHPDCIKKCATIYKKCPYCNVGF